MRIPSVLACLALVGATTVIASPAHAAPLTCGATVTVSTNLTTDLTCPASSAPALTLGAGVTLDLRGHTIAGPGTGRGIALPPYGDAAVRNGTLTGWGAGIYFLLPLEEPRSGTRTIDRVSFSDSDIGADISGDGPYRSGEHTIVTRSRFDRLRVGLETLWAGDTSVMDSTFTDTRVAVAVDTSTVAVATSRFTRGTWAIYATEGVVTVTDSTFVDNEVGVGGQLSISSVTVDSSTFRDNDVGVDGAWRQSLTNSLFVGNTTAIELRSDTFGDVTGNAFRRNGTAVQGSPPSPDNFGIPLVVTDNVLRHNGDALVFEGADENTQLGDNTAVRNTGWGIYAPGATDLGGNTAHHNGNEPQCVGVVCSARGS